MIKLFLGILLGLIFLNNGYSSTFMWNYDKGYVRAYLETNDSLEQEMNKRVNKNILKGLKCQNGFNKTIEEMPEWVLQDPALSKNGKLKKKYQPFRLYKITCLDKDQIQQVKQDEMMFTINDKREQCEAIGFKPETEKFADCVLRLVELDIKKQQKTQVTVAQNNGNDALVKQLQRQNNIQSSQALINLGQQLMQPKKFNSNIYMPQTQHCTVQGFGSFSSVTCR